MLQNRRRAVFAALALTSIGALIYVLFVAVKTANMPADGTDSGGMLLVSLIVWGFLLTGALLGCLRVVVCPRKRPPQR